VFGAKYSFLEAKAKLEALCAYQERCPYEMELKLQSWNFNSEQTSQLIADLIINNFLNEERFAAAYVSGKFTIKKWGRHKIKNQLKSKKISSYSIQKGLVEIDPDAYWATLESLAVKKKKELSEKKGNEWDQKKKITSFLLSRGYESDLIMEVISQIYPSRSATNNRIY
jgi:regulatory protein